MCYKLFEKIKKTSKFEKIIYLFIYFATLPIVLKSDHCVERGEQASRGLLFASKVNDPNGQWPEKLHLYVTWVC
jgi:hypothetical protein